MGCFDMQHGESPLFALSLKSDSGEYTRGLGSDDSHGGLRVDSNIKRRKGLNKARTARNSSSFAEREQKIVSYERGEGNSPVGAFHDGNGLYTEKMKKQDTSTSPMKLAICCWASHQSPPYIQSGLVCLGGGGASSRERGSQPWPRDAISGCQAPHRQSERERELPPREELPPERSPLLQLDLITGKLPAQKR